MQSTRRVTRRSAVVIATVFALVLLSIGAWWERTRTLVSLTGITLLQTLLALTIIAAGCALTLPESPTARHWVDRLTTRGLELVGVPSAVILTAVVAAAGPSGPCGVATVVGTMGALRAVRMVLRGSQSSTELPRTMNPSRWQRYLVGLSLGLRGTLSITAAQIIGLEAASTWLGLRAPSAIGGWGSRLGTLARSGHGWELVPWVAATMALAIGLELAVGRALAQPAAADLPRPAAGST